ncbi:hypothetical protein SG34_030225 [Thalassomonas viridans]|uniref:Lipoprotein n=1 Tax=Thalassomonas viridans TaxID=137584 RepID=A0AAE9ZAM5_9GAMM|nr:hypothetical protein [Thalassomonas viridans]WDE09054.1 hypothetical protein SG34_030225 [Thalassomonas viridans]
MKYLTAFLLTTSLCLAGTAHAGSFDTSKGMDRMKIKGELVCTGCSLKKLSGANAQCSLYSLHDIGLKLADGTLWTFVNNEKGHDIIRAHHTVLNKKADISGWLYPNAHQIEIAEITVEGVSAKDIAKAAWLEDQKIAKALASRKVGQAPEHDHGKDHH